MVNSSVTVFPNSSCGACGGPPNGPLYNLVGGQISDCVFDPQVAWDQSWGHWMYVMTIQHPSVVGGCGGESIANITNDRLVIGWTYTSDANDFLKGNYCWMEIDRGSNLDDFPKLGHDDNSIVVGANVFANYGQGAFLNSEVWVITKPANVSLTNPCGIGGPVVKPVSLGSTVFTPVPADMTDSSTVDYIVAAQQPGTGLANNLFVWQSSPSSGVTFVGYFRVADYQVPPDVPQPSTGTASCATSGTCLDTLDARLTQAVGHYDPDTGREAVWTQHAISNSLTPPLSVMRWYEIVPATGSVRQSGNVSDSNLYMFNGAISPTVAGNKAVIVYNAGNAAADGFVSFRARSRDRTAPLGTMSSETVLATSTVSDADFSCGVSHNPSTTEPCRWGDYPAARPDPANANAVWGFEMLTGSGGSATSAGWSTEIADVTPPACSAANVATDTTSPQPTGTHVNLTASSTCPDPNPLYEFWMLPPGGPWSLVQPYSTNATYRWDSTGEPQGNYHFSVWVRDAGSSGAFGTPPNMYDAYAPLDFALSPAPCTGMTASSAPPSTATVGTPVSLTGAATGCPNPRYEFWLLPPGRSWSLVQPYSASDTYRWNTTGFDAGSYRFSVWARDVSSTSAYEAFSAFQYTLTLSPCT